MNEKLNLLFLIVNYPLPIVQEIYSCSIEGLAYKPT